MFSINSGSILNGMTFSPGSVVDLGNRWTTSTDLDGWSLTHYTEIYFPNIKIPNNHWTPPDFPLLPINNPHNLGNVGDLYSLNMRLE